MKYSFTTTKALGITTVMLATAVGIFLFLLFSIRNEVDALQGLSQEVKMAQEHVRKLDSLRATVLSIEDDRSELDRYFLGEQDIVGFLETIESLGSVTNTVVEVTSVDQKNVPRTEGEDEEGELKEYTSLLLTIETLGSWNSVFRVLALLESLPVPLVVHRVAYDIENAESSPPTWVGVFQVSVVQL